jgi:ribosome biogenesis protein UTP30
LAHEAGKKKDARNVLSLDDDEGAAVVPAEEQAARTVWLNVGLVRMTEDGSLKPVRLPVPHPWRSADAGDAAGLRVCLVVKDPQREYKDAVAPLRLSAVAKVSGVGKLRKKFPSFEQRRQLVAAHDMFLADKRVFAMLPSVLGKEVYARRKHPVPVDVSPAVLASPDALKRELTAAIEATYLIPSAGTTSLSIRVGVVGQSAAHIAANVDAVVRQLATKLDGGLANVRSLHVKTPTSAALPIYARTAPSS